MATANDASPSEQHRLSCLIIEDEFLIAYDLTRTLEDHGFDVYGPAATTGSALDLIIKCAPDVAIVDVIGENWLDYVLALKHRKIPFIVYSGHQRLSDAEALVNIPWITKPAPEPELIDALTLVCPRAAGIVGQTSIAC